MASESMIISGRMSAGVRSAGFQAGLSPLLNRAISTIPDDEEVCPKCGGHPPYCCGYQDSASISSSAYERYQSALNNQQNDDEEKDDAASLISQPEQTQQDDQAEAQPGLTSISDSYSQSSEPDVSLSPIDNTSDEKTDKTTSSDDEEKSGSSKTPATSQELSKDEAKEVEELKKRDTEVRQHEQAHLAAAGHLASGGAQYDYEKGPDGRQYATGGHVSISVGGGDEPEERMRNAQQAERAALAPAEPSAQDRKVAAEARQVATEAQKEINDERASQATESEETSQTGADQTEQADPAVKKTEPEEDTSRNGITSPSESEEQPEESTYPAVAPVDVNPFAITDPAPSQPQPGDTSEQPTSAMGVQDDTSPFSPIESYNRQSPAADAFGENENHATSDDQGNQNGIMSGNQNGGSVGQAAMGNGVIQANSMQQSGMILDENGPLKRAAESYRRNSNSTSSSRPSTKKLAEFPPRSGASFNRVA